MRCDECQITIEAYFDGEVDVKTRLEVARHLGDCAPCARLIQRLKAEQEVYLAYEPQVEIRPELRALVQSRIAKRRPTLLSGTFERLQRWLPTTFTLPQVSGWATAALVLVAIGLTVAFMKYTRPGGERTVGSLGEQSAKATLPAQPSAAGVLQNAIAGVDKPKEREVKPGERMELAATTRNPKTPLRFYGSIHKPNTDTPDRLVREAEQKYLAAIAMLTRTVERKRTRLDALTLARLEQTLVSVDRTIAGTRKVVRQHPDDPVAVQYMLNAYSRKVDVLREMIGY